MRLRSMRRMLYEYRSDDPQCMAAMKDKLNIVLRENALPDAQVEVKILGERPCGTASDKNAQSELENAALQSLSNMRNEPASNRRLYGLQYSCFRWEYRLSALACIAEKARIHEKSGLSQSLCVRV